MRRALFAIRSVCLRSIHEEIDHRDASEDVLYLRGRKRGFQRVLIGVGPREAHIGIDAKPNRGAGGNQHQDPHDSQHERNQ
jgi:hypothetical protein